MDSSPVSRRMLRQKWASSTLCTVGMPDCHFQPILIDPYPGVGALCAPLVSTKFSHLHKWSYHYITSFGIALSSAMLLAAVFRFKTQDECLAEIGQEPEVHPEESKDSSKYNQMLRLRELHLLAIFILIYVGVEVTAGSTSGPE